VAWKKAQIEQSKDRGRNVSNGSSNRLKNQPTADRGTRQRQNGIGKVRCESTVHRPLGADEQKLAGHQGCFGGRTHALELSHPKELQQGEMHDHPKGDGEPPTTQTDNHDAEQTSQKTTAQTLAIDATAPGCRRTA